MKTPQQLESELNDVLGPGHSVCVDVRYDHNYWKAELCVFSDMGMLHRAKFIHEKCATPAEAYSKVVNELMGAIRDIKK